jgi:hypothetical protein
LLRPMMADSRVGGLRQRDRGTGDDYCQQRA